MGTLLAVAVQVRSVVDVIDSFRLQTAVELLDAAVSADDGSTFFGVLHTDGGHLVKLEKKQKG